MKKLEDLINESVKAALKADVVPEKEEKETPKETALEEVDEDVCDKCGGDLVLIAANRCICENCGEQYEIE